MASFNIEIEATNICNTRCVHCPREAITRPLTHMTREVFEPIARKIIDSGYSGVVNFSGMGEPTLNPLLPEFIAAFSDGLTVCMTTNGSSLTGRYAEKLFSAGLKTLIVSFNGADSELFSLMSGGLNFDRIIGSLREVSDLATGRAGIIANVSVTNLNRGQVAEIKAKLEGLGITSVLFAKGHNRGGHLPGRDICSTPMPPFNASRCDILASTLFIASNGEVLACCHDLKGQAVIGDLLKEEIDDVIAAKASMLEQGGAAFSICAACNDLYRFMRDPSPDGLGLPYWVYLMHAGRKERSVLIDILKKRRSVARETGERLNDLQNWLLKILETERL